MLAGKLPDRRQSGRWLGRGQELSSEGWHDVGDGSRPIAFVIAKHNPRIRPERPGVQSSMIGSSENVSAGHRMATSTPCSARVPALDMPAYNSFVLNSETETVEAATRGQPSHGSPELW